MPDLFFCPASQKRSLQNICPSHHVQLRLSKRQGRAPRPRQHTSQASRRLCWMDIITITPPRTAGINTTHVTNTNTHSYPTGQHARQRPTRPTPPTAAHQMKHVQSTKTGRLPRQSPAEAPRRRAQAAQPRARPRQAALPPLQLRPGLARPQRQRRMQRREEPEEAPALSTLGRLNWRAAWARGVGRKRLWREPRRLMDAVFACMWKEGRREMVKTRSAEERDAQNEAAGVGGRMEMGVERQEGSGVECGWGRSWCQAGGEGRGITAVPDEGDAGGTCLEVLPWRKRTWLPDCKYHDVI